MAVGLQALKKPFAPVELNMDPGSAIGINGEFLQPNPWSMTEATHAQANDFSWGDDVGASKTTIAAQTSLGALMVSNCYKL